MPLPGDPYYHNPRPDVIALLPDRVERMLDVGCASGAFGRAVKELKHCEVWGIEIDPNVASMAGQVLDSVHVGDAVAQLRGLESGSFDLVTCNDVLEHLAWPEQALVEIRRLLRPDGTLVCSLPNLKHWPEFRRLLFNGEFDYTDSGILDRTHLRFFTKKSIERFFPANGFEIVRLVEMNPSNAKSLRLMRLFTGRLFADCRALQYGIVAKPRS